MSKRNIQISKFLSLVLRHQPEKIGLTLDAAGWVDVEELLRAAESSGFPITREELEIVVAENDKKRFSFSEDGQRIRASQGHSVSVELGYEAVPPPEILYHGTIEKFLASILEQGLLKGDRHHVHLSSDLETAKKVGARRGRPIVLLVQSGLMRKDGHLFYRSENGVWLTDAVPAMYLTLMNEQESGEREPPFHDMQIRRDDLGGHEIQGLLAEHLRSMYELSPPESVHALDLEALRKPEITFWTVWSEGDLMGCGALKELAPSHGEIKSMRTASAHRRKGVARAMLIHILEEARRRSYKRLSLETGSMEAFLPARRLYASFGFIECGPFAEYSEDPNSIFMSLVI